MTSLYLKQLLPVLPMSGAGAVCAPGMRQRAGEVWVHFHAGLNQLGQLPLGLSCRSCELPGQGVGVCTGIKGPEPFSWVFGIDGLKIKQKLSTVLGAPSRG